MYVNIYLFHFISESLVTNKLHISCMGNSTLKLRIYFATYNNKRCTWNDDLAKYRIADIM